MSATASLVLVLAVCVIVFLSVSELRAIPRRWWQRRRRP